MISLLFFACDHYRFYELKDKIKSSAYFAASMLQQIGNTRSNKQIKLNDLRYITYASCLNFFHTNSMFYPWSFGICYAVNYTWVKRINNNSYSRQGAWTTAERKSSISPETMHCFFCPQSTKTLAEVLQEDQDLICYKDEDERLVITCYYYKTENYNKSLLGFYILEPSLLENTVLIKYKLVITPKPGLFPGTN